MPGMRTFLFLRSVAVLVVKWLVIALVALWVWGAFGPYEAQAGRRPPEYRERHRVVLRWEFPRAKCIFGPYHCPNH